MVPQGGPARLSSVWWVVFEAASDSATHCGGRSGEELCTGRQGGREGGRGRVMEGTTDFTSARSEVLSGNVYWNVGMLYMLH